MITRFLWNGMSRNLRLFVLLVLAIGIVAAAAQPVDAQDQRALCAGLCRCS